MNYSDVHVDLIAKVKAERCGNAKKALIKNAFFLLLPALPMFAFSSEWYDSKTGITWNYEFSGDDGVVVVGTDKKTGYLSIPTRINGCTVTGIGESAFEKSGISAVAIPSSVKRIESSAFWHCESLSSVSFGNSVVSIGDDAFGYCGAITSITIPSSVVDIGNWAFHCCGELTSVIFGTGLERIGMEAFESCEKLSQVSIPPTVTDMGEGAFSYCTGLKKLTISSGVTCIGGSAFLGCKSLASVTIPGSVESIGQSAFYECTGLSSVVIQDGVESIEQYAFYSCRMISSLSIPSSVLSIGECAFESCGNLKSVALHEGLLCIEQESFCGCGLTEIIIPKSVLSIADGAFSCDDLTSVVVLSGTTKLGGFGGDLKNATLPGDVRLQDICNPSFITNLTVSEESTIVCDEWARSLSALTSVSIPSSVVSIGENAFSECSALTCVRMGSSVTSVGTEAFCGCGALMSVELPSSVRSVCDRSFSGCGSLTKLSISSGVEEIGAEAFNGCSALKSIAIPSSVLKIGDYAFFECTGVVALTIHSGLKNIGEAAFSGCIGLTSVEIPSSVTIIGDNAFSDCSDLKSITISSGVEHIGSAAFCGCHQLSSVTIPSSVTSIGVGPFGSCANLMSIVVAKGNPNYTSVDGVLLTKGMETLIQYPGGKSGEYEVPSSVAKIDNSAFYNCCGLTSVMIPTGVTSIGEWAFSFCENLVSAKLSTGVTEIGSFAFWASGLVAVTIPATATKIGYGAFGYCDALETVDVDKGDLDRVRNVLSSVSGLDCSKITFMVDGSPVVYCSVRFDPNFTGGQVESRTVIAGNAIRWLSVPARNGYDFLGWFSTPEGGKQISSDTVVTGDVTFYAHWAVEGTSEGEHCLAVDGVTWRYEVQNGQATILWINDFDDKIVNGHLVIPANFNGIPVISIGNWVCNGCDTIESIEISASVTNIGWGAFSNCFSLKTFSCRGKPPVGLDAVVLGMEDLEFDYNLIYESEWQEWMRDLYARYMLEIPQVNGVLFDPWKTEIVDGIEWVYRIDNDCAILGTILTDGGDGWFSEFQIPLALGDCPVTCIGDGAFRDFCGDVIIPFCVTNIGTHAFANWQCVIPQLIIPSSVRTIGASAFPKTGTVLVFEGAPPVGLSDALNNCYEPAIQYPVRFADEWKEALALCEVGEARMRVADVVVDWLYATSNGVITITGFQEVENVAGDVRIPATIGGLPVKHIDDLRFDNCQWITSFTIPEGVESIGAISFDCCSSLTNFSIASTVADFDYVDLGLTGIETLNFPQGARGRAVYCKGAIHLKSVALPCVVEDFIFEHCGALQSVAISSTATEIPSAAFCDCPRLTNFEIPLSVRKIWSYAFSKEEGYNVWMGSNGGLTNLVVPASVQSIGNSAFDGLENLSEIAFEGPPPEGMMNACISTNAVLRYNATYEDEWLAEIKACGFANTIAYEPAGVHMIAYDNLHGISSGNPRCYHEGAIFSFVPPTGIVTGYTFAGWTPSGITAETTGDQAVTANWTANSYEVQFHANGGSGTMANQAMTYDAEGLVSSNGFTYAGHYFVGWSTTADGEVVYGEGVAVSNLTATSGGIFELWAKWAECIVATPTITPADGSSFGTATCTVTLTCETEGATIYYRTGGGSPKATAKFLYSGPFTIDNTTTIKAFAIKENWTQSALLEATLTKIDMSLETALGLGDGVTVTTGGDEPWLTVMDDTAKAGDKSVQSGMIGDSEESWIQLAVTGAGTLTFWTKVSCEADDPGCYEFDHLLVEVDGVENEAFRMDGESEWVQRAVTFTTAGAHTVKVVYQKDDGFDDGEDCAWLDGVVWTPSAAPADPIPDLGENPTVEEITNVFVEAKAEDPKLAEKITTEAAYTNFSAWAKKVQPHGGGDAVGAAGVMAAPNAWVSYALGSETLLEAAPTDADLTVEAFEPKSGEDGKFDFTVSVKDVEVGGAATTEAQKEQVKENLKQVFGLEGGTTLEPGGLSSANVDITFGTPENGKVKFTAGPNAKNADAKTFFMKVNVVP